ncbi:hypothetical protein ABZ599_11165 [Streptomyces misionensis]|uniref:hypothetical protein n=1 Tax=Streptomyces misionensis TaxID=67331 RepID=UPI0033D31B9D
MATVSGVPENLFGYSDQCTRAAAEMQNWIRTVLGPAINDFENGGGVCLPTSAAAATAIVESVKAVDRDVRLVGTAFEQAGAPTARPGRKQQYLAREQDMESALRALERAAQHQGAVDGGAALAATLAAHPGPDDLARVSSALAAHAGDPYYTAGFFNHLSSEQIAELLNRDGTVPALVSAYSSGILTQAASANVVRVLGWLQGEDASPQHSHITAAEQTALLKALAANSAAAANFARSLSAPQIRSLFFGLGPVLNPQLRPSLLNTLTAGEWGTRDPEMARTILAHVSSAIFADDAPDLPADELDPLLDAFAHLYTAGADQSIPPPDVSDPRKWADDYGTRVGTEVGPLLRAVRQMDSKPNNPLFRSMIQGGYLNVLFMPTAVLAPESVVGAIGFSAAVGALQSFVGGNDPFAQILKRHMPDEAYSGDASKLNQAIAGSTGSLMMSSLISHHLVIPNDGSPAVHFTGDQRADSQLLQHILANRGDYHVGSQKYPPTVDDVIDHLIAHEAPSALTAIGGHDYKVS